ncbi:MAG: M23 family metallopeptidase [Anaerolineae bacterium]|nr:M23 family metallopeptidase [Anaerolineae bacterium]
MKKGIQICIVLLLIAITAQQGHAYSLTDDRPVFLAWPLPSYIGVARISQFPNSPWTWNYLGLNPGQQCTPAFGYLESSLPTWRDTSLSWEEDAAQADPHQFQMIACYATAGEAGANGHEGTDIKAPVGTPVFASADGKVAGWRIGNINDMLVLKHCLGGTWDENQECSGGTKWYTTYMHINVESGMQQMDLDVQAGTLLGTIINQGDNSHLHFEVGLDKRNYDNFVNPWGRDHSPWLGCMWKDQSLCVLPNPALKQMLFQTTEGSLIHKRFYSAFETLPFLPAITKYQIIEDRIAAQTGDGILWLLDASGNWIHVADAVQEFQVTATRLGVLKQDGSLYVQAGIWDGQWDAQATGVKSFSLSEKRVGALGTNGELYVIEGDLNNSWSFVAKEVSAFQLLDTRIAYVDAKKDLMVQEGKMDSEWKLLGSQVTSFQLAGVRVAYLNEAGELWVNHGNLRGEFILQSDGVQTFQLADDRILIKTNDGIWKIKQGDLYDAWVTIQLSFIQNMVLNGHFPTE